MMIYNYYFVRSITTYYISKDISDLAQYLEEQGDSNTNCTNPHGKSQTVSLALQVKLNVFSVDGGIHRC
jgi:hypothetical protein